MKFYIWSGSHVIKKAELDRGLKSLKKLGFEHDISPQVKKHSVIGLNKELPFLSGTDEIKVSEFVKISNNPKAHWILATRGGYGCLRLLKLLDKSAIQRTENLHVWGYSDLTVLQLYLWQRKGWEYVQGPLVGSETWSNSNTEEKKVLTNISKFGIFPSQFKLQTLEKKYSVPSHEPFLFIGGNLASIVSMLGTNWEPRPTSDFVLFLEDIDEAAYRCDRLLAQLKNSRFFDKCRGLVLGHFTKCPGHKDVFKALSKELKLPIYTGIPMGHEAPRIPIILGKKVIFNKNILRYADAK